MTTPTHSAAAPAEPATPDNGITQLRHGAPVSTRATRERLGELPGRSSYQLLISGMMYFP
jgi:hypothetical protein